jgi:hypothetical protein
MYREDYENYTGNQEVLLDLRCAACAGEEDRAKGSDADQEFIAHSREDVSYLLARVAQLEATLEGLSADRYETPELRSWARGILRTMPEVEA